MTKSAMEQMVEWLEYYIENVLKPTHLKEVCSEVLKVARRLLAEEQAQKPGAPAGLDQIIDEAFVDCTNGNFSKADLLAISTSYMVLKKHIRERYHPAPSSADEGLREELEDILDLGDDVAKHMDITIKGEPTVLVSYIKEILSRHPSTKSDRCAELVKRLRERINKQMYGGSLPGDEWGPGSEFFYKTDVSNMLMDLRTILDEFEKEAGK